jgi:ribonuclease HII
MQQKYNYDYEIGVDEAGRGPLIGRVYAGAVIWGANTKNNMNIIDSKKLSAKKRGIALKWIKENVYAWGVGYAEPSEIDSINILEATRVAMERAIDDLKSKVTDKMGLANTMNHLIIDGCYWEKKFPNYKVISIVKGDAKFLSIAAASIIAKEYHDMHIRELCKTNIELNERYDLESNMGYGTKKHMEGLAKYGPSIYHRKSFKPCNTNLVQ